MLQDDPGGVGAQRGMGMVLSTLALVGELRGTRYWGMFYQW